MGPRVLLRFDVAAALLAFVGAGVIAPTLVLVFAIGVLAGAVLALTAAWHYMTPMFRTMVRASIAARRERVT